MSEQDGKQATSIQRPPKNDPERWKVCWETQGQPWRTEPEIDAERQVFLTERRSITPDIEKGIYPFKGIDPKLSRADVEWLLATHDNGHGPIDWSDESQRKRKGLDLRGADLRQEDLSRLPLAQMRGGISFDEWREATEEQRNMAAVQLQEADLRGAQLQEANLRGAQLHNAELVGAQLHKADLIVAQLQGANLKDAQLQGAVLRGAQLHKANLVGAQLQGADLSEAQLDSVRLNYVTLSDERHGTVLLADTQWGEVNLAVIDWGHVTRLGDEEAAQKKMVLVGYLEAVRANRQLAVVLHNQGLNEDAARFSYRAQLMQRKVFWHQGIRSLGQYLFSLFLALLTGYGYKPIRSFITYSIVISMFAFIYYLLGTHLAWNEAIVISMTAFHGRGFFPEQFHPGDPQALVAAIEAFVGLLIEVTFIATLTQRLFGK